jgi:tight adherence protein B
MTGAAWAVAACLVVAVLVASPSADRRLLRVSRPGGGPRWSRVPLRRRRPRAADGADVVSELATLLRAGLPPSRAWAAAAASTRGDAAVDAALAAAAREAAAGADVAGVLRRAAPGSADPVTTRFLHALSASWQVAASTGAPTAAVLDRLAATLREEADLRDARATAMAAPRASARVLVALPVVGLVLGQLVGAAPLQMLVGSGVGRVCALVGGLLSLAAWWWTRRLVLAAQRP